ncbi:MAG: hypothetical protein PHG25_03005 [Candidatus Pacebacteria bacterium]|nr:hypothetical protein [Candidatus Paceibacterota bacterium]
MIKRYLSNLTRFVILPLSGWVVSLSTAHAQGGQAIASIFGFSFWDFFAEIAAWVSNMALSIMQLWVTVTGAMLNVSITLTMHIKEFVDSIQGVYVVWQTIRDISGMFIIFMLLYAAFKIILSRDGSVSGVGTLIKNVVIMGVLINFSFFIVSLLIDASNIVSLALYNSIVTPTTELVDQKTLSSCPSSSGSVGVNTCIIATQMMNGTNGGLSDIFLNYLKPQLIYNSTDGANPTKAADAVPLQILIQGIVGCIIMFTIGFSFLLASLAFVVRLIVLILLLAFSPIWFASFVIPQLKEKADHFTKHLTSQLIFMPVYLLLLYAALRILTTAGSVFSNPGSANAFQGTGDALSFIPLNYVVLAVNDFFIIFLLNIPLVTAFSMGGIASDWIKTDRFGAKGMWKTVGGYTGTRTIGRWASSADKALGNTRIGNSLAVRDIRSATIGAVAKSKMGGDRNFEELGKAQGEVAKKNKEIVRGNTINGLITGAIAGRAYPINPTTGKNVVQETFGKMNEKEKLALVGKNVTNDAALKETLKHLKSSDFDAIKKSDDFSDEDKAKIANMRKDSLDNSLVGGHGDVTKHMVENMDGKDLLKLGNTMLINPGLVEHLKPSQLKMMSDEGLADATKRTIGRMINTSVVPHKAKGFVNKNNIEWL